VFVVLDALNGRSKTKQNEDRELWQVPGTVEAWDFLLRAIQRIVWKNLYSKVTFPEKNYQYKETVTDFDDFNENVLRDTIFIYTGRNCNRPPLIPTCGYRNWVLIGNMDPSQGLYGGIKAT
jgi:hypothetical protein